jgi:hypothetical protein
MNPALFLGIIALIIGVSLDIGSIDEKTDGVQWE